MSAHDGGRAPAIDPVYSGDNLCTDDLPALVPCYEGKDLQIGGDCTSGLSTISVRDLAAPACCSDAAPQTLQARNSFRCVHRPELRRVPGLRRLSPAELRRVFLEFSHSPQRPIADADVGRRAEPAVVRPQRSRPFPAVLAAAAAAVHFTEQSTTADTQDVNTADNMIHEDETQQLDEKVQVILRPNTEDR